MTIFDLLFILFFFSSVIALFFGAVSALHGHRSQAIATFRRWSVCALIYLGIVFLVSAFLPMQLLRVGEEQCSDDWCIAVQKVNRTTAQGESSYGVTFQISSRAGRITQRENGLVVYLTDERGTRYNPAPDDSAIPLHVSLPPLQSVKTFRVFKVPADAHALRLIVAREGGFQMRWLIMGRSPFDKRTMVQLD